MPHVVLLGDSIFDNQAYVRAGEPDVIHQLRERLPDGWRATLLAVDGDVTNSVHSQLERLPADATHLVISVGGNDALGNLSALNEPVHTISGAFARFATLRSLVRGRLPPHAGGCSRARPAYGGLHGLQWRLARSRIPARGDHWRRAVGRCHPGQRRRARAACPRIASNLRRSRRLRQPYRAVRAGGGQDRRLDRRAARRARL